MNPTTGQLKHWIKQSTDLDSALTSAYQAGRESLEQYPLPDSLYPDSKDWIHASYAERVELLHVMLQSKQEQYQAGRDSMLQELRAGGVELPESTVIRDLDLCENETYDSFDLCNYGDRRAAQAKATARDEVLAELRAGGVDLPTIVYSRVVDGAPCVTITEYEHNMQEYGDRRAAAAIPPGMVLVPEVPTERMLGAALCHIDGMASMPAAYRAMLQAAKEKP